MKIAMNCGLIIFSMKSTVEGSPLTSGLRLQVGRASESPHTSSHLPTLPPHLVLRVLQPTLLQQCSGLGHRPCRLLQPGSGEPKRNAAHATQQATPEGVDRCGNHSNADTTKIETNGKRKIIWGHYQPTDGACSHFIHTNLYTALAASVLPPFSSSWPIIR